MLDGEVPFVRQTVRVNPADVDADLVAPLIVEAAAKNEVLPALSDEFARDVVQRVANPGRRPRTP